MAADTAPAPRRLPRATASIPLWRRLRRLIPFIVFIGLWQLFSSDSSTALLPSPVDIVQRLWDDVRSGDLAEAAKPTAIRGFAGLGIAVVCGIALGLAMGRIRPVRAAFEPLLAVTFPIPRLALYPVMVLVFGLGATTEIILVALECTYPLAYNTLAGVEGIQRDMLRSARNAGASGLRVTTGVLFRGALPSILAGMRIAVPVMLIVVVIVEMLSGSVGLGYLIRNAQTQFEPDAALAVVLALAIVGYLLDRLIVLLTRTLVFWERDNRL